MEQYKFNDKINFMDKIKMESDKLHNFWDAWVREWRELSE